MSAANKRTAVDAVSERGHEVIGQTASDFGEMMVDRDAVPAQVLFVADTGEHQQLGSFDGPTGEDHFLAGADGAPDPVLDVVDADGGGSVEYDPVACASVRTVRFARLRAGRR